MKWTNKDFRQLPPKQKLLFMWLCDACDMAGCVVWDDERVEFETKLTDSNHILEELAQSCDSIERNGDMIWLRNHLEVQGNLHVTPKNNIYKPIYEAISRNAERFSGLADILKTMPSPFEAPSNPLPRGNSKSNSSSKGYTEEFETFWKAYPKGKNKGDAFKAWKQERPPIADVLTALEWQVKMPDWTKERGKFVPYPGSYIRARGWEDDKQKAPSRRPTEVVF